MNHRTFLASLLVLAIALPGCQTTNRESGAIIGGIAGGLLGSQVGKGKGRTAAIILGTIAGAYIGGSIGRSMDENDRYQANDAIETTPTNQTSSWRNPDSGNYYEVTPTRTYDSSTGPCRDYTTEAIIDGRRETVHGTACRDADGNWVAEN
ncbi:MAG: RT0821/Lpp0805 family surface protein [Sedimenticola sp.]